MFGFYGRILTIDLSSETFRIEPLSDDTLAATLGGKGLATRLLLDRNPPGVDPLAPENHLIIATGPFCQSPVWGASRYGVFTKSPLTGFYAESYSGGKTPEAIDAAGFDAVVVTGAAQRPTVVTVHPDGATFFDATALWGKDTHETETGALAQCVLSEVPDRKKGAVVIGPAGEKQVRFALIENDKYRSAGRTGVGAVMGAKKLKAMVFQGDRKRPMAQPAPLRDYGRAFSKTNIDAPGVKAYRAMGTTMMVAVMNTAGAFPARYWSQGTCDHWEKISGETFHKTHQVTAHACAKCFMACGRMATLTSGRHEGLTIEGPEYETIYAFGGLCMIDDIAEIAYLNDLCDRLGVDTITAGNLCAFVIEGVRQKKIDVDIDYGDAEKIAELIEDIAAKRGIGEILAEGIAPAARHFGLEDIAIHVKGMEPAGYDPRVLKGMGLTYAISERGACHLRTTFYKPELSGMIPPDTVEGKAALLIDFEDRLTLFDTLILCRFYRDLYTWEEFERVFPLVFGEPFPKTRLQSIAAAVKDMTRAFNLQEGLHPEDDTLPRRLLTEALPSGHTLTADDMTAMRADYYHLRGWDPTGRPAEVEPQAP